ncbi:hypothetical protein ETAA8_23280 [Anatilimnocola aggregata]|uniref:Uncharacterized protein n=1 Tax=Anatilimnocola aggregata TaxID=2528021 RepID=A0A517YAM2_9BACT|nr:hypothetical protein ETAA8_23280 [Anatilimnocola aggregata]
MGEPFLMIGIGVLLAPLGERLTQNPRLRLAHFLAENT